MLAVSSAAAGAVIEEVTGDASNDPSLVPLFAGTIVGLPGEQPIRTPRIVISTPAD